MSKLWTIFGEKYFALFSLSELRDSRRLQAVFAASWFLAIFDLVRVSSPPDSLNDLVCWSYLPNCRELFNFAGLSQSYAYPVWNAVLLALLVIAMAALVSRRWVAAHASLSVVILWKFLLAFVLVNAHTTNFELFHLIPSFVLLFARNKLASMRYAWALAYLFCARVKLDDGWILGTYFSSTKLGLPLIPESLIPLATNLVIAGEILFSVGLIWPNRKAQRTSFWAWTLFHLYSTTLVGFFYPVRCLAFLWTLFAFPRQEESAPAPSWLGLRTTLMVAVLCFVNFLPSWISPNSSATFEGLDYGFFMINSNYQCLHQVRAVGKDGSTGTSWSAGSTNPMTRCYPQDVLQRIQRDCEAAAKGSHTLWTFAESRNGGPFYELIHEEDACKLEYQAFTRNPWIHLPAEAPIVGYPEKNSFTGGEPMPVIHPQPVLEEAPSFLRAAFAPLKSLYAMAWALGFIFFLATLFRGLRGPGVVSVLLLVAGLAVSAPARAADGFIFKDDLCRNAQGVSGLNTGFMKECTDLRKVDLGKVPLNGLRLGGSNFELKRLRRLTFFQTGLQNTHFKQAKIWNSRFQDVAAIGSDFRGAVISQSKFIGSDWSESTFAGAKIESTLFDNVNFVKASFRGASLKNVVFKNCNLSLVDFSEVVLSRVRFVNNKFDKNKWTPATEKYTQRNH
jgi:hypothetical protein